MKPFTFSPLRFVYLSGSTRSSRGGSYFARSGKVSKALFRDSRRAAVALFFVSATSIKTTVCSHRTFVIKTSPF